MLKSMSGIPGGVVLKCWQSDEVDFLENLRSVRCHALVWPLRCGNPRCSLFDRVELQTGFECHAQRELKSFVADPCPCRGNGGAIPFGSSNLSLTCRPTARPGIPSWPVRRQSLIDFGIGPFQFETSDPDASAVGFAALRPHTSPQNHLEEAPCLERCERCPSPSGPRCRDAWVQPDKPWSGIKP